MGVVVAVQWPQGLYVAGLLGLQRHVRLNLANAAMVIVRGGGAVLILWLVSPSLEAFFLWQVAINALTTLLLRALLWGQLPPSNRPTRILFWLLRDMGKMTTGLTAINTTGAVVAQMDKLLLSHLLPLRIFGIYAMASVMASGIILLGTPIFSSLYPRFSQLVAAKNVAALADIFHRGARIMSAATLPAATVLVLFAPEILRLWTRDAGLAAAAAVPLGILVGGTVLTCICATPHALLIAKGQLKFLLWVNLVSAVLTVPLLIVMTEFFGMAGAASVRLMLNIAALVLFGAVALRHSLPGESVSWYRRDIADVALPVIAIVGLCRWLVPPGLSWPALFAVMAAISAAALFTGILATRLIRPRALVEITIPRSPE
jgi:O-antigen/teichoic acid export membrane protein